MTAVPSSADSLTYPAARARLLSLADSERAPAGQAAGTYDLQRLRRFLRDLGDPHLVLPTLHVAGTKGKGSVAAMLASVLHAAGLRTGLYTSPHLHTIRERLQVDGAPLDEATFARLVHDLWPRVLARGEQPGERLTTFELLTAMAFVGFRDAGCAYQVLEVGLGGRLDATNVIERPLVSVITALSLDHTHILGGSLEQIAYEKAGIVKDGCAVVVAPQDPVALEVLRAVAEQRRAPLRLVDASFTRVVDWPGLEGQAIQVAEPDGVFEGWIPLLGEHQVENAACALAACRVLQAHGLPLTDATIRQGLRQVRWPGRLEVLQREPLVMVDGAHNPASAARLRAAVQTDLRRQQALLVLGVSSDKDLDGLLAELAPVAARVFASQSRHARSRPAADIVAACAAHGVPARSFASIAEATDAACAASGPQDLVLGTGSLFVVAEVREHLQGIPTED